MGLRVIFGRPVPGDGLALALYNVLVIAAPVLVISCCSSSHGANITLPFNRTSFPSGFMFGAGSAAYQSEGAACIDGKGPSIWDTFTKEHPEIWDHSAGNIADDTKAGVPIGTPTALNWLFIYPKGIYYLMMHVKGKYKNPPIYITENGLVDANKASLPIKEALKDGLRIREGANVKGYYAWLFMDDFEWDAGYKQFGSV